ncbi:MAG: hypothetical protein WB974_15785 [Acidobacteriaceae bacterium]
MKIARQTETELVFVESSYWIAGLLVACSVGMALMVLNTGNLRGLIGVAAILLFSLAWMRRATILFDGAQRMVRWTRVRLGRTSSGSVPFSEITDIAVQSTSGPNCTTIYRLAVVANDQTLPFCDVYSGGSTARYEGMREAALKMLGDTPRGTKPAAAGADGLDGSIRSLLEQGRTLDAIELVRASDRVTVTAATQRVRQVRQEMVAGSVR